MINLSTTSSSQRLGEVNACVGLKGEMERVSVRGSIPSRSPSPRSGNESGEEMPMESPVLAFRRGVRDVITCGGETMKRSFSRVLTSYILLLLLGAMIGQWPRAIVHAAIEGSTQEEKKDKKDEELPIKPTETIEFTTDEGTWMSLDVSPDGQTIIFDLLGDIYTLPISGGEATRIIGGMSFESQPKFSPDGKKIVFLSDRSGAENVWLANADGSDPKPLTKGRNQMFCSPTWTPDGRYVVVSRGDRSDRDLFALDVSHRRGHGCSHRPSRTAVTRTGFTGAGASPTKQAGCRRLA